MKKAKRQLTKPHSHEVRPRGGNSPLIMAAFARIAQHRCVQNERFAEGHSLFTCSSMVADDSRKLRQLAQALGGVASSIEALEYEVSASNVQQQLFALTNLAAHCVAWLEAMEARDLKLQTDASATARKLPRLTEEQINTVLPGRSL